MLSTGKSRSASRRDIGLPKLSTRANCYYQTENITYSGQSSGRKYIETWIVADCLQRKNLSVPRNKNIRELSSGSPFTECKLEEICLDRFTKITKRLREIIK